MHAQLSIERSLKLDAFDRVDSLQAQVMESERDVTAPSITSGISLSIRYIRNTCK